MGWVYETTADNSSRFVLGTTGGRPLICLGLNPSTAEPNKLDRTLSRVSAVAALQGYDSFLMLNVYPLRSTNPTLLPREVDSDLIKTNARTIARLLDGTTPDLWAAWGTFITKRSYLVPSLVELLDIPELLEGGWRTHGPISKDGHPHHPLYVNDSDPLMPFDMARYLSKLRFLASRSETA